MFDEEFGSLPMDVQDALKKRLEEVIRMIYGRWNTSNRDYTVKAYSADQISAMIFGVFDLADRLKAVYRPSADAGE